MKNNIYLWFLLLFFASCAQNIISKPEKLLSEADFENLMYDLSMISAIKDTDYQFFDTMNFDIKTSVYQKYKTDSIALVENVVYYSSFPKTYDQIVKRVETRLQKAYDDFKKADSISSAKALKLEEIQSIK